MFDFLKSIDKALYQRYKDIESSISASSDNVYLSMQVYLEYLLKYIIQQTEKDFYLERRESLGTLLSNVVFMNFLEDTLSMDYFQFMIDINHAGNQYKHVGQIAFDITRLTPLLKQLHKFSIQVAIYFQIECDEIFDEHHYYNLINSQKEEKIIMNLQHIASQDSDQKNVEIQRLNEEKSILEHKLEEVLANKDTIEKERKKQELLEIELREKNTKLDQLQNQLKNKKDGNETEDFQSEIELSKTLRSVKEQVFILNKQISEIKNQSIEDVKTLEDKYRLIIEEKNKQIESLLSDVKKNREVSSVLSTQSIQKTKSLYYNFYDQIYSSSYIEDDDSFMIVNLNFEADCRSQYHSFYAVIFNLLQRSKVIKKSSYLNSHKLSNENLSEIIRYQIMILLLIKNNKLSDSAWKINLINRDKEILKYAISDLLMRVNQIIKLAKLTFVEPEIELFESEDVIGECINIGYGINRLDSRYMDVNKVFLIENTMAADTTPKLWITHKINYSISDEDENVLASLVNELFGFNGFKEGQFPILKNTVNGNSTIGILPTGGGKSLIFQLTTLLQPKITIIVAPINALIIDQVGKLVKQFEIRQVTNLTGDNENFEEDFKHFSMAKTPFVFVSPERVQNQRFRDALVILNERESIGMVAFDEVHCLSEWGHDFRISYLMLTNTINRYCKNVQLLGLTATASINVIKDLKVELNISDNRNIVFLKHLKRDNLNFSIKKYSSNILYDVLNDIVRQNYYKNNSFDIRLKEEKTNAMVVFFKGKGMLEKAYRSLIQYVESETDIYHGDSKSSFDDFMNNKKSLLLATKAFGIGVDKPNIRTTIHFGLPSSRESFYQEAGRAGRDGQPSNCMLLTYDTVYSEKTRVEKLLNLRTTITEMHELIGEKYWNSDLWTNFVLMKQNLQEPSLETELIYDMYLTIITNKKNNIFKITAEKKNQNNIEKALYTLHKIGVVQDWTVAYYNGVSNIIIDYKLTTYCQDLESIIQSVIKHLVLYGNAQEEIDQVKKYKKIDDLKSIILIYRKWYHRTFIQARREQLSNMISMIERYKNQDVSDQIQKEMDQFFDITSLLEDEDTKGLTFDGFSVSEVISELVKVPADMLSQRVIEMEKVLESTSNYQIDIYTGLVNLRNGTFAERNGKERFVYGIEKLSSIDLKKMYKLIPMLYKDLSQNQKVELLDTLEDVNISEFENLISNLEIDEVTSVYTIKHMMDRMMWRANNELQ